jgi:hypothetical protein
MSRPFWFASTDARDTHTGDTLLETYVSLPVTFQANSTNIIFWGGTIDGGTTGTDVSCKLYEGATYLGGSVQRTAVSQANGGLFHTAGFAIYEAGASPSAITLELKFGNENNSGHTSGIQDGYIGAFPLGDNDEFIEALAETTISVGSYAAGTEKLELAFTPPSSGDYLILANVEAQPQTAATDVEVRLWDGTTAYDTIDNWQQRSNAASSIVYGNWFGGYKGTLSGAQSWKIQSGANANSIKVRNARIVALRIADLCEVQWAEQRASTSTTNTTTQVRTSFTHTALARPHVEIARATVRHDQTTNTKFALTVAGTAVDTTQLQSGTTTATNFFQGVKLRVITPSAGSRTLGVGYGPATADTTHISDAWVLAIRPNVAMPPRIMGGGG